MGSPPAPPVSITRIDTNSAAFRKGLNNTVVGGGCERKAQSAVDALDSGDGGAAQRALALSRRAAEQDGAAVPADAEVVARPDDVVLGLIHALPLELLLELRHPALGHAGAELDVS